MSVQEICRVAENTQLGDGLFLMVLHAPKITELAQCGQFVHIACGEGHLLRRPISICTWQGSHLRLEVSRDDMKTTVMYFGCTAERFGYETGDRLDFAVTADVGEYSGREQVTLTVRGVRASEGDDDALLRDIRLYERLRRKEDISGLREDFLLTRDDVAAAYRSVRRGFDGDCEALMLHSKLGYLKLRLALDVLDELGLANIKWNMSAVSVQIADATRKFDLDESPLYNRLSSL